MLDGIEQVRRLWRGESISLRDGTGEVREVYALPRPIQPELPIWLTAVGSPKTFEDAGRLGYNVLTALLQQTVEELAENLNIYRAARKAAGHDPRSGMISVMLHTFVAESEELAARRPANPSRIFPCTYPIARSSQAGPKIALPNKQADIKKLIQVSVSAI